MRCCRTALVAALLAAGVTQGAAANAPKQADAQPSAASRAETIDWLRTELAKVRQVPADQHYEAEGWRSRGVSSLVGMSRAAVGDALGEPDVCPPRDRSPCVFGEGRVVYEFFRLGGRIGGGPHLAMRFDRTGVCTHARWILTK